MAFAKSATDLRVLHYYVKMKKKKRGGEGEKTRKTSSRLCSSYAEYFIRVSRLFTSDLILFLFIKSNRKQTRIRILSYLLSSIETRRIINMINLCIIYKFNKIFLLSLWIYG